MCFGVIIGFSLVLKILLKVLLYMIDLNFETDEIKNMKKNIGSICLNLNLFESALVPPIILRKN